MTVKDFALDEQPRERAMRDGVGVLSTADLWALILRTGLQGLPITELTRNLMNAFNNSMREMERRNFRDFMELDGIGPTKAIQIDAVLELVRRYNRELPVDKPQIRQAEDIYKVIAPCIAHLDHEEIWVIFLNRYNKVESKECFTKGSATASVFDVKSIIRHALMVKAEGVCLCHNHPSGNLSPSPQDDNITHKLFEACKMFDITMLDHVIATSHGYYSYHDEGRLR